MASYSSGTDPEIFKGVAGKQKLQPRKYFRTEMVPLYARTQHMHVKHANTS